MSDYKCVCCGSGATAYCSICRKTFCKSAPCLAKHPTELCRLKRSVLLLQGEVYAARMLAMYMTPKYIEGILAVSPNQNSRWHAYAQSLLLNYQKVVTQNDFIILSNFVSRNHVSGMNHPSKPPGTICDVPSQDKLHSDCSKAQPKCAPPNDPSIGNDLPHDLNQDGRKKIADESNSHANSRI